MEGALEAKLKIEVQSSIVHQVRNSKNSLTKMSGQFLKDLQNVYKATTLQLADAIWINWSPTRMSIIRKHSILGKNWRRLSKPFQYNKGVRRIMYITNIIEGFDRQSWAVTKLKGALIERRPDENSIPSTRKYMC
jgi:putative transposase